VPSNIIIWVDGADPLATGTPPANAAVVSTWFDKSGHSNNMAAGVNGTYSANTRNGLGTITFSSSVYRSAITTIPYYPVDAYIVVRLNSLATHNDVCGVYQVSADNFNGLVFGEHTASRWHNGSSGFSRTPLTVSSSNETSTSFLIMSWSMANNNFYIYRNGVQISITSSYSWTPPASVVFLLGARIDLGVGNRLNGSIAEAVVYTAQLNTTDRQEVEGYLAWKWGLQTELPGIHPYRNSAPPPRPPAPTNVIITRFVAANTGVTVTWTAATGITSYIVDFYSNTTPSTIGGSLFQTISVATTTATSTNTLGPAIYYYYAIVSSVNASGLRSIGRKSSNTTTAFRTVSGLFVWLDSQDPTSYTLSGSTLASPGWIDKVTNLAFRPQNGGPSNTVTSSANYPTLSNAGLTSAGIFFSNASSTQSVTSVGIQANLSSSPLTFPTQNMTVCMVITNTASNIVPTGRLSCCLQLATNTIATRPHVYFLVHTNTNEGFSISQDYTGTVWSRALYTNVPSHTVSKQILIGRSTSNLTTVHQNGTSIFSNATVYNSAFTNYNIFNIGIAVNNNGARCWEGTVHEIMVFNRFLTDTERIDVEGYLAWKCGMNTSLPAGHLYRNNPFAVRMAAHIAGATTISVSWDAISGATSYTVRFYSNTTPTTTGGTLFETFTGLTTTSQISSTIVANTYYYASVVRVNSQGSSSEQFSTGTIFTNISLPDTANLLYWFDASDTTSLVTSGGTNVSTWANKGIDTSNSGRIGSPSGTVTTNVSGNNINNLNTVRFANSARLAYTAQYESSSNTASFFVIFRGVTTYTVANRGYFFCNNNGDGSTARGKDFFTFNFRPGAFMAANITADNSEVDYSIGTIADNFFTASGATLMSIQMDGTATNVPNAYMNGTAYAKTKTGIALTNTKYYLTLGSTRVDALSFDMCEFLLYRGVLDNTNRQRIEGYLARKWGIQSKLPATHPFR
jgi:hypothetical protein